RIERFEPQKVWTAVLFDADQGYPYLKRFTFESSARKQSFTGDNPDSRLIMLSDNPGARYEVTFKAVEGMPVVREPLEVVAREFIAVKSLRAKGKRLTNFAYEAITELEPVEIEEEAPEAVEDEAETSGDAGEGADTQPDTGFTERSDDEVRDELTGQGRIF
ncbi:MAG: DNA gyrase/topoisomerase IV subunit A, partial [Candidatus Amulumruptor sp.]|nr:DNA gyrase/topoisomerase IV subunit A [Candidatus Amulumruptor sp.]